MKFNLDGCLGLWTTIEEGKNHEIWLLQRTEDFQSFFWWDRPELYVSDACQNICHEENAHV